MLQAKVVKKGIIVATTVGTILTIINQFDALFGASAIRVTPLVLTYIVPFCVFLFGAYQADSKSKATDKASTKIT